MKKMRMIAGDVRVWVCGTRLERREEEKGRRGDILGDLFWGLSNKQIPQLMPALPTATPNGCGSNAASRHQNPGRVEGGVSPRLFFKPALPPTTSH